jgi:hypothetical protein
MLGLVSAKKRGLLLSWSQGAEEEHILRAELGLYSNATSAAPTAPQHQSQSLVRDAAETPGIFMVVLPRVSATSRRPSGKVFLRLPDLHIGRSYRRWGRR